MLLEQGQDEAEEDEGLCCIPSYIDKFMWRERFGKTAREAMDDIIYDIAQQYPV